MSYPTEEIVDLRFKVLVLADALRAVKQCITPSEHPADIKGALIEIERAFTRIGAK